MTKKEKVKLLKRVEKKYYKNFKEAKVSLIVAKVIVPSLLFAFVKMNKHIFDENV